MIGQAVCCDWTSSHGFSAYQRTDNSTLISIGLQETPIKS